MGKYFAVFFFMALAKAIYIFSTALEVKYLGKHGIPLTKMLTFGLMMIPFFYIAGLSKWVGHNLAYSYTNWWGMSITYEVINLSVVVLAGLILFNKPIGFQQYAGVAVTFLGVLVFHLGGK